MVDFFWFKYYEAYFLQIIYKEQVKNIFINKLYRRWFLHRQTENYFQERIKTVKVQK